MVVTSRAPFVRRGQRCQRARRIQIRLQKNLHLRLDCAALIHRVRGWNSCRRICKQHAAAAGCTAGQSLRASQTVVMSIQWDVSFENPFCLRVTMPEADNSSNILCMLLGHRITGHAIISLSAGNVRSQDFGWGVSLEITAGECP